MLMYREYVVNGVSELVKINRSATGKSYAALLIAPDSYSGNIIIAG